MSPKELPIERLRGHILEVLQRSRVVVLTGAPGCGKSTMVPQYVLGMLPENKRIAVTQPRRSAAVSLATYVAQCLRCKLGQKVGYTIRFEDVSSEASRIVYMTDGILLRHCMADAALDDYGVIMVDEAHERSVNTDIILAILKRALKARSDLKVIVSSATLEAAKFMGYFEDCERVHVEGCMFDVDVRYEDEPLSPWFYRECAKQKIIEICESDQPGDILVFLTGEPEIIEMCGDLEAVLSAARVRVFPLFGNLTIASQRKAIMPLSSGKRKVVLATNIAEASLTVDGVVYVIDCGKCKMSSHVPHLFADTLTVVDISKASAEQRRGRAGRTQPGVCMRLYTEDEHAQFVDHLAPEILRTNLSQVLLQLLVIGVEDVTSFEWIDAPDEAALYGAWRQLYLLNAIDEYGRVTDTGKQMAEFPMNPCMSRTMLTGMRYGVSRDVSAICAMLTAVQRSPLAETSMVDADECDGDSIDGVEGGATHNGRREMQDEADLKALLPFRHDTGDLMTYLNVFREWQACGRQTHDTLVYMRRSTLQLADDVYHQLLTIVDDLQPHVAVNMNYMLRKPVLWLIQRSFVEGYFLMAAKRVQGVQYMSLMPHREAMQLTRNCSLLMPHAFEPLRHNWYNMTRRLKDKNSDLPFATLPEYAVCIQFDVGVGRMHMRHVLGVPQRLVRDVRMFVDTRLLQQRAQVLGTGSGQVQNDVAWCRGVRYNTPRYESKPQQNHVATVPTANGVAQPSSDASNFFWNGADPGGWAPNDWGVQPDQDAWTPPDDEQDSSEHQSRTRKHFGQPISIGNTPSQSSQDPWAPNDWGGIAPDTQPWAKDESEQSSTDYDRRASGGCTVRGNRGVAVDGGMTASMRHSSSSAASNTRQQTWHAMRGADGGWPRARSDVARSSGAAAHKRHPPLVADESHSAWDAYCSSANDKATTVEAR